MFFAAGGPPWTLRGGLEISLIGVGDGVSLPGSAEVVISPDEILDTPIGACCFYESGCQDEIPAALCEALGGDFQGVGTACAGDTDYDGVDDMCTMTRPVPALTGWGLAVLTLLLVIAGITIMRRLKAQAT